MNNNYKIAMQTIIKKQNQDVNFARFKEGDEKGLEFFYKRLYPALYFYSFRYIKDDINADCIVNEAFLRLWLVRRSIQDPDHIEPFIKKLTTQACKAYYRTSNKRFQRNMLRLDEIENYDEFIFGHDPEIEEDTEVICQEELENELKEKWIRLKTLIPNLTQDQQLIVRLCLKYSFNYDRIAWHIGGISDYQVARKVEKTLESLKAIFTNSQKLEIVGNNNRFRFEGDLNEEQSSILHMRYQLQYSFEEISSALNLDQGYIKKVFVGASIKIKKVKM
ncbi:RNA polymerase sigma factor, sigma-70 family [Pedobacter suwonensis]|uniref:RNA polymerase sigma factor, sigma-70 family n=1 Tax=Pedobacter suwonensis TaxID=332999 RepID=A0A1I0U3C7_9SPHI|nr:sigma-70 family RNA polymerase sigma factor [Pedobacter suwonensis]SFA58508.1 RNA polymerase sigma factor, sigma-70 family [Pedobacter suwonensis]